MFQFFGSLLKNAKAGEISDIIFIKKNFLGEFEESSGDFEINVEKNVEKKINFQKIGYRNKFEVQIFNSGFHKIEIKFNENLIFEKTIQILPNSVEPRNSVLTNFENENLIWFNLELYDKFNNKIENSKDLEINVEFFGSGLKLLNIFGTNFGNFLIYFLILSGNETEIHFFVDQVEIKSPFFYKKTEISEKTQKKSEIVPNLCFLHKNLKNYVKNFKTEEKIEKLLEQNSEKKKLISDFLEKITIFQENLNKRNKIRFKAAEEQNLLFQEKQKNLNLELQNFKTGLYSLPIAFEFLDFEKIAKQRQEEDQVINLEIETFKKKKQIFAEELETLNKSRNQILKTSAENIKNLQENQKLLEKQQKEINFKLKTKTSISRLNEKKIQNENSVNFFKTVKFETTVEKLPQKKKKNLIKQEETFLINYFKNCLN